MSSLYYCHSFILSATEFSPLTISFAYSEVNCRFSWFSYELKHKSARFWPEYTICFPLPIMTILMGKLFFQPIATNQDKCQIIQLRSKFV